jgi:alpha-glucosidase
MPVTLSVHGFYVSITEAGLKDYGDLALHARDDGVLEGSLYADKEGWETDSQVVQPWRVTIVARNLSDLVNTTLVQNLNPPPADPSLATATWIKPGRASWQWLSSGGPVEGDQRQWVDWTQELRFEYYLVDEGWEHWKDPWGGLADVVSYAATRGVKIWVWVNSNEVLDANARKLYFEKFSAMGVAGVKIDFPHPTNRAWSSWYFDTAKDAASYHLMVNFHGASKPTGMERTWPNVLTREAVRGHEWQITRYKRQLDADHDTILPFTRYVVGPADYTPTVFKPAELLGNTWAHELAQAITFTSPFLCFGGAPQDYINNPAKDVLMAIPATWDETRVLAGSLPGKVVVEARRSGQQWFIAVVNGGAATSVELPLDFLGAGKWSSTQLFDVTGTPAAWNREEVSVTSNDHIRLTLEPRGGFVARLRELR